VSPAFFVQYAGVCFTFIDPFPFLLETPLALVMGLSVTRGGDNVIVVVAMLTFFCLLPKACQSKLVLSTTSLGD